MTMKLKIESLSEMETIQDLARTSEYPVYLASDDESTKVDARTFLGLFTVDFSKPVKVVTDSLYVIRRLENAARLGELKVG